MRKNAYSVRVNSKKNVSVNNLGVAVNRDLERAIKEVRHNLDRDRWSKIYIREKQGVMLLYITEYSLADRAAGLDRLT